MRSKPTYEGNDTDIAIIGLSVRLPGADTVRQFWEQVKAGHEAVADFSDSAEAADLVCSETGRRFIATNSNLKDIESFDAFFFDFSPRDATLTDPQHRLFLECAWEAMEDAGYDPRTSDGLTGLYAGVYANYYSMTNLLPAFRANEAAGEIQLQIANEKDHLATMAAYKLDLTGPVMNVQSACSTSLAAIHLGCESLLTYSSDMMICGAATLSIPQVSGYAYQDNGLLSSDGHLRAFDANATGTIYSDGAGCVVLKRLRDAWNDGDTIHAVIKGTALNNDGSARVGYAAPGVKGQVQVIERAQLVAGIEPESIAYIEAHGTGTPLGDAIELEALHEVFAKVTEKKAFCALGSVKSNYGHTGPSAGVIGLIKTVMALKEKKLPPTINVETPSGRLMNADSPFYLNSLLTEWTSRQGPRRAAVSSFGLGGTNVHAILEEAPPVPPTESGRSCTLLALSARSADALREQSRRLRAAVDGMVDNELADAAYTLAKGRRAFEYRGFFLCRGKEKSALRAEDFITGYSRNNVPPAVFVFPERLSASWPLLEALMEQEPFLANQLDEGLAEAKRSGLYQGDIRELLEWQKAEYRALAGFVVQHALSRLWTSWGIVPEGCHGTGTGAFAAACAAGMLELGDALALCVSFERACTAPGESRSAAVQAYGELADRTGYVQSVAAFEAALSSGRIEEPHQVGGSFWKEYLRKWMEQDERQRPEAYPEDAERTILEMSLAPLEPKERGDTRAAAASGAEEMYHKLGLLWIEGHPVDWAAFYAQEYRRRIGLPTYPFERKRYWLEEERPGVSPEAQLQQERPLVQLGPEQLTGYVPPRSEVERQLVQLWESYLGVTPIGVEDNYYELGGNSLLAASLHERICGHFNVDLGLQVFFEQQTIANLAQAIEACRINSIV